MTDRGRGVVDERREALKELAESDNPASWVAAELLEAAAAEGGEPA